MPIIKAAAADGQPWPTPSSISYRVAPSSETTLEPDQEADVRAMIQSGKRAAFMTNKIKDREIDGNAEEKS